MKTAVVICPGRGTYGKAQLGVLGRHFPDPALLAAFDARRKALGQETLGDLDGATTYSVARHTRGDNAAALIYAATLGDLMCLRDVQVVAVTGNSMGWYSALACAGALTPMAGFDVVNTMGTLMQQHLIGGQLVYPFIGDDWVANPVRRDELFALVEQIATRPQHILALSIDLGGMLVIAGNDTGLSAFQAAVPPVGRFPMRLQNHAAFHTSLQKPVSNMGRKTLNEQMFVNADLPLIDGRGHVWWPGTYTPHALWDYTFGYQVTEPYDFTKSIRTAAREFAPDLFIVTGPGATLGGAVAQSLILAGWRGMTSKADFQVLQARDPILVSMGLPDQRHLVTGETP